jgi:hypothetical protein
VGDDCLDRMAINKGPRDIWKCLRPVKINIRKRFCYKYLQGDVNGSASEGLKLEEKILVHRRPAHDSDNITKELNVFFSRATSAVQKSIVGWR